MKIHLWVMSILFVTVGMQAQIILPTVWRDSMILQRDMEQRLWGKAGSKEKLKITFNDKLTKTVADEAGNWQVILPAMNAGGPYNLTIEGKTNKITISQILFGDVYLCIGQSNMVHQMDLHNITYASDIANANDPDIRHVFVPPMTNLTGKQSDMPKPLPWKSANPKDVGRFTAVGYFFAKQIHDLFKIPIGLINASVGGTPIEAWMSESGFQNMPNQMAIINKNKDTAYINNLIRAGSNQTIRTQSNDKGLGEKWYSPESMSQHWHTINIPGYWEDQGLKDLNGVVWYRKHISLSPSFVDKQAKLYLGRIVDADELYINGQRIGCTTYQYPQRRYSIPPGIMKTGDNLLVVRVTNNFGKGGFVPDKPYALECGKESMDLKGTWEYKVGEVYRPRQSTSISAPGFNAQNQPTALYNAMVAPYENFNLKGVLWYQGESNTSRATEYEALQIAQIKNLRDNFHNTNLPFLFVQLPNFMDYNYLPSESDWAKLRDAQLKASKTPNTAMAVAIDLGEWNDIHPDNKKSVAERLALAAENIIYKKPIEYSGPVFKSQTIIQNKIIIEFDHAGNGITTQDGEPLSDFAIAGEDRQWVWAKTQIENNKIFVWSDEVPSPKYVRYAWADNPINPNLVNKEGLMASPFRTDQ